MKIDWTEPAIQDLESIRAYIARDAEYYAIRFIEKIIEAIDGLEDFPLMGRPVPEAEEENKRKYMYDMADLVKQTEEMI